MEKFALYLCVVSTFGFVNTNRWNTNRIIIFPDHVFAEVGSSCSYYNGGKGSCVEAHKCPEINNLIRSRKIEFREVRCDLTVQGYTLVCCKNLHSATRGNLLDISAPEDYSFHSCEVFDEEVYLRYNYPGNATANELIKKGFKIIPIDHYFGNHLTHFAYYNSTFHGIHKEDQTPSVRGGVPAGEYLGAHMALLQGEDGPLCGGVLISKEWVLTAAHCFDHRDRQPTLVTLGEYDLDDYERGLIRKRIFDFSIKELIMHPEYEYPSSNHDLALIRMNGTLPYYRPLIKPVCLPWGNEATKTHVGEEITLTGWGHTIFDGEVEPVLQEANVTVFETSRCDAAYSNRPDYRDKFPNGITDDLYLCAGHEKGGVDACQGDSGGPVIYGKNNDNSTHLFRDSFTLAGIVSTGYGCGNKEYPGLYIPINNPKYLSWIKKVAFAPKTNE